MRAVSAARLAGAAFVFAALVVGSWFVVISPGHEFDMVSIGQWTHHVAVARVTSSYVKQIVWDPSGRLEAWLPDKPHVAVANLVLFAWLVWFAVRASPWPEPADVGDRASAELSVWRRPGATSPARTCTPRTRRRRLSPRDRSRCPRSS